MCARSGHCCACWCPRGKQARRSTTYSTVPYRTYYRMFNIQEGRRHHCILQARHPVLYRTYLPVPVPIYAHFSFATAHHAVEHSPYRTMRKKKKNTISMMRIIIVDYRSPFDLSRHKTQKLTTNKLRITNHKSTQTVLVNLQGTCQLRHQTPL